MTLQQLQPLIDTSVATKTAHSVLDRVFHEIDTLSKVTEYSDEWIKNSLNILRFSADIEVGFSHSKAAMLAVFKQAWDSLPFNFKRQFGLSFLAFAMTITGKAKSTVENRIATAQLWILEAYGSGKRIEIRKRTPEGKPILDEYGKQVTEIVEFCPYAVDISKLEILNPRARAGDMTDKLWEMLADPFYSCDDIRVEHNKDRQDGKGPQYVLKFDLLGPSLVVYQNGDNPAVVAEELNWTEYETDPLVKEAIDTLLKFFNIEYDEDKIHRLTRANWK